MSEKNLQQPISLESLRSSFNDEKIQRSEVTSLAYGMQYELGKYFDANLKLEPRSLDEFEFGTVYDPSLATIIVDSEHTFSGVELLGLASHEDNTRANVFFVPTTIESATIKKSSESGASYLEVTSGVVVLPDGQVAYGDFPVPVVADAFDTADLHLIEQCENNNIPLFHSSKDMRHFNDKGLLDSLSNNDHAYTPRRIDRMTFLNLEEADNLVVKPSKHSQGRGVLLTDENADLEYTKRFYRFLEENNYEPVVEERARSWEISDPMTNERLDWNVRAILSYGDLIDMYVRADVWGGPVNMSISARAISMDEFPNYFSNAEDAWQVMQILHDSAQAVAEENPSSLIGVDLTVDENMKACLFEINNGNVGGLQTIAKLEQTYDGKLDMARKVLKKFIEHTPMDNCGVEDEEYEAISLRPSFNAIARTAYVGKLHDKLRNLDVDEIPHTDEERYGAVLALVAIRTSLYRQLFDYESHKKSGKRLEEEYPLELRRYLAHIYSGKLTSFGRKGLSSYLDEHSELFRDDPETLNLRARLAGSEFDLKAYKDTYLQFVERFKDDAQYLYENSGQGFMEQFQSLMKDLSNEEMEMFIETLDNAVTAYCEYGYDAADATTARSLERAGSRNSLSHIIHSLQFCTAYGAERYDDALCYFRACEQDFDEPWEFYEHIVDPLVSTARSDLDRQSGERRVFILKLEMLTGRALVATVDMIDYLRSSEVADETRLSVARTIADYTPLECTDEEREHFVAVLLQAAAQSNESHTAASSFDFVNMSNYAKYTLLIEKTFAGEHDEAEILIEQLQDVEEIANDLHYLKDVYIDNIQDQ